MRVLIVCVVSSNDRVMTSSSHTPTFTPMFIAEEKLAGMTKIAEKQSSPACKLAARPYDDLTREEGSESIY